MAVGRVAGSRGRGVTMKAKAVGRPAIPPGAPAGASQLAKLTGKQVLAEIGRRHDVAIGNTYAMALCLKELSRAERYRDELGFKSFEELLAAHEPLPTRMTAHKWFTVIAVFTESEVRTLGGMEKSYHLIRLSKRKDPNADPRKLLATGARVLGQSVTDVTARGVREGLRTPRPKRSSTEAKRAARRLRGAFRRVRVAAEVRVHSHDDVPCVATHLAARSAGDLVLVLKQAPRAGPT